MSVTIFLSYAAEDRWLLNVLESHLLVMDTSDYVNVVTPRRDPLTGAYFCLEYQKDDSSPDGKRPTGVRYLFWFVS